MKKSVSLAIIIFLSACPYIYTQSIGFSVGHGFLGMKMVNDVLESSESFFYDEGLFPSPPEEISGGFFFEGNFKYGVGIFNFGVESNYVSSSGSFYYKDDIGAFEDIFDVSTVEFLGLIEIVLPSENSIVQPFFQAAGGIGIASVAVSENLTSYTDPGNGYNFDGTMSGNYFSGRFKSGLQLVLEKIRLEAAVGYRIADAGVLRGDFIQNRTEYKDMPLRNADGKSMAFDFSGFLITGGISFHL